METSEVVLDYLRQRLVIEKGLEWSQCPPQSSTNEVCVSMRILCEEFHGMFEESLERMIDSLSLTYDKNAQKASYLALVGELFVDGVKWSHIVALFVFSGELAVNYAERNWKELINAVGEWLIDYVDQNLMPWIEEHGGWAGLVEYQKGPDRSRNPWPRLKNWVCGVAAAGAAVLTLGAFLTSKS